MESAQPIQHRTLLCGLPRLLPQRRSPGEDGFPLAPQNRYMADTLVIAPGSRFDLLVHANNPGVWAFHCHILNHVEGPNGMFGMVTALIVQ